MAIAYPHYRALKELHSRGELPQGGSILEIGEANWYGDVPLERVMDDIRAIGEPNGERRLAVFRALKAAVQVDPPDTQLFDIAKVLYKLFFDAKATAAIDFNGTKNAQRRDLNTVIVEHGGGYETVINHGTAEHIFDIANVFRVMHDHCAFGGLMIHESPFTGWVDHGFYTLQPTLYLDVAAANGYQLVYLAVTEIESNTLLEIESREHLLQLAADGKIPNNSMLFVVMRKTRDEEFKIPMQGVYAGTLSEGAAEAWKSLR